MSASLANKWQLEHWGDCCPIAPSILSSTLSCKGQQVTSRAYWGNIVAHPNIILNINCSDERVTNHPFVVMANIYFETTRVAFAKQAPHKTLKTVFYSATFHVSQCICAVGLLLTFTFSNAYIALISNFQYKIFKLGWETFLFYCVP